MKFTLVIKTLIYFVMLSFQQLEVTSGHENILGRKLVDLKVGLGKFDLLVFFIV